MCVGVCAWEFMSICVSVRLHEIFHGSFHMTAMVLKWNLMWMSSDIKWQNYATVIRWVLMLNERK